jgi:DNA-binding HxlR family transcriptional regulator
MIFGARRFSEFVAKPEAITRNILTDRLRRMEAAGLIERVAYQSNPARFDYVPTAKGADLVPAIQALAVWGGKHLGHVYPPPEALLAARPGDLVTPRG